MQRTAERGWHSRGYLPHFDGGPVPVSITYRLAGSIPRHLIDEWREELSSTANDADYRRSIEDYLDRSREVSSLRDPRVGALVEETFFRFDGERYRLHAWVIMPNHVHVLITPNEGFSLSAIVHSWKSYTSRHATRILEHIGSFWQPDYFDRTIRDERHFEAAKMYIEHNPVKAGLCSDAGDWPFSSARRDVRVEEKRR